MKTNQINRKLKSENTAKLFPSPWQVNRAPFLFLTKFLCFIEGCSGGRDGLQGCEPSWVKAVRMLERKDTGGGEDACFSLFSPHFGDHSCFQQRLIHLGLRVFGGVDNFVAFFSVTCFDIIFSGIWYI